MKSEEIISIFDSIDYKEYLKNAINRRENKGRGFRALLARELRCQTAYISQIFNGSAHFTPEQSILINKLLGHSDEESKVFILRVLWARAGSFELKEFYRKQIDELNNQRLLLRERFKTPTKLTTENQMLFYSEWYYTAIHVLTSIPEFQNPQRICELLHLPLSLVMQVLSFLIQSGLVKKENEKFIIGPTRIHLGSDSPLIGKHHMNWRLKAMQSLIQKSDQNLHYSSCVSLSEKDALKLRGVLINQLEQFNSVVAQSPEEVCYSLALDFFAL